VSWNDAWRVDRQVGATSSSTAPAPSGSLAKQHFVRPERSTQQRLAWRGLLITPIAIWILIVVDVVAGRRGAPNGVHIDFYVAAVAIFPTLFVAGIVEIAAARLARIGGSVPLIFLAIPSGGGTAVALFVLATGRSTDKTLFATCLGLVWCLVVLLLFAWDHSEKESDG
jgi:hypothetical protein